MNMLVKLLKKLSTPHTYLAGYMNRDYLYKTNKIDWRLANCRLHKILRSDQSLNLHIHPWNFLSIILSGGYYEITPYFPGIDTTEPGDSLTYHSDTGKWYRERWYGPGSIIWRNANDSHRLRLPEGETATTLFFHGPKLQKWGFATKNGIVSREDYFK